MFYFINFHGFRYIYLNILGGGGYPYLRAVVIRFELVPHCLRLDSNDRNFGPSNTRDILS